MAHQPKAYKKFVASAATATLVATAIVPVASAATASDFTDVNSNYKDAVTYLVEQGITNGKTATTFGTTQNITRGDAAVFIARALKLDVDGAKDQGFTDLNNRVKNAVNAIVEAKIAGGKSDTKFDPDANITRQEMAKMLANAYGLTAKENANFKDVNSNWIGYVSALKEAGITLGKTETTFAPTANLTRGEFALFMYRAEGAPAVGVVALSSVKAINAKTIELTFNKAVETDKAAVELLRDSFKQNVTLKWADDKKSVQLIGAGNFQAGDYTVNVTGLGDKTLTGSVKIEAQKVSSIQILSDVAVLSANPDGGLIDNETATVGYVVKDQYGTDITKTTDLTTNDSTNVKINTKGTVDLTGLKGKRIGDLVPVVLVHAQSGTTTSATLKLSAAATVADISVDGVYNAKGEKVDLKDNTVASDVYLVVNLKDQYGNAIAPANSSDTATGVIVTNTNPLVAKLVDDKVTTATIDGKNKFVVKFGKLNSDTEFKGGSAELLFILTMNGKTFNHTVNVVETKTTDAVSLGQPQYAVVGEAVKLPITVLDKEGNVITDKDLLTHATKGIKVNGSPATKANIEVKDGQVYYNLGNPTVAANSYATATVTTSTNKVSTITYKVNEAAKPVAVRGLKKALVVKSGSSTVIDFAKVNVEDQYGRTMTALPNGYSVEVENIASSANQVVTVTDNKTVVAGDKNGAATLTIYLKDASGKVANSAVEQQVRVTDGKEYSDYEVAQVGKVQVGAAKAFTVNGILGNGKVKLDTTEYTAEVIGAKTANADGGKITVTALDEEGKLNDKELTLRVTINATGKVIEQKFIASKAPKTVQDFFFTTESVDFDDAEAITDALVAGDTFTIASEIVDEDGDALALYVATTDQYDNDALVKADAASPVVTIVPTKASDVSITGNGTSGAKAVLATGVNQTVLTVKVKIGDATKELKVTLKKN
ncbi:S-layer homology domain-containing protein [Sporosarcina koreensis]|uniref:S-layer homology domain-containing protein n=1 Tax=Sporosarcina koreensis TaxID=334735 RepID=A0ABW0U238_9BACL